MVETRYEQMYGSVEKAADQIATKMLSAAMDASPFPLGCIDDFSSEYFDQQVALVEAAFGPMRRWAREMLSSPALPRGERAEREAKS